MDLAYENDVADEPAVATDAVGIADAVSSLILAFVADAEFAASFAAVQMSDLADSAAYQPVVVAAAAAAVLAVVVGTDLVDLVNSEAVHKSTDTEE